MFVISRAVGLLLCLILGHSVSAQIKGYVGAPSLGGVLKGWACDTRQNTNIPVHVYLGGAAGKGGRFFKSFRTNSSSESAVHRHCGTSSAVKHRFNIQLTAAEQAQHAGKTIFIHGISQRHPNLLLGNSGRYKIPARNINIKGHVDRVQRIEGGFRVQGWACQNSISQNINVHVYSGESRRFLGSYPANRTRETAVQRACQSSLRTHGFDFVIPNGKLGGVKGEVLHVHGVRRTGSVKNEILANSTRFRLPRQRLMKLSEFNIRPNRDIMIMGDSVRIDRSIDVKHIHIHNAGILRCSSSDTRSYTMKTDGIMIHGSGSMFQCGWNTSRFQGRLEIKLKTGVPMTMGGRDSYAGIMSMENGQLILHGKNNGTKWTRLNANANAGSRRLRFVDAVNWNVGDNIAIGSSSFNMWQSEVRRVTAIDRDRKGVTIHQPLRHFHRGVGYSSGGKWINLKSEVINLTRNIKITTDGNTSHLDRTQFGGHVMAMTGGRAQIKAVHFDRMGQMGEMGRYPFHWHKVGNVASTNQYFNDNSITNSYQRCVTVHGTHGAKVINNVCYNHFGHGYFLEDGNEVNNAFHYNVGMLSKRVPLGKELLISDSFSNQKTRFDSPATFWISNPKNDFVGNVASGSQGSGFWNSFVPYLNCESTGRKMCRVVGTEAQANVYPAYERTLRFDNNVAHSTNVGFTWDGAARGSLRNNDRNRTADHNIESQHYHARGPGNRNGPMPRFNNLTSYKNIYTGVYYRGNKSVFQNYRSADNGVHLFIAFSQVFRDSIIVGDSGQSTAEKNFQVTKTRRGFGHQIGMVTYDGPTTLERVHFAGFPSSKTYAVDSRDTRRPIRKEVTPVPIHLFGGASHFEHQLISLSFAGNPYYKVLFEPRHVGWKDAVNHVRVRDVTGSVYGRRGELIVPRTAILDQPGCRVLHGGRAKALGCDYDLGTLHHGWTETKGGTEKNKINFSYSRSRGPGGAATFRPTNIRAGEHLYNKAGLILDEGHEYRFNYDNSVVRSPGFFLEARNNGRYGPVMAFPNTGACSIVRNWSNQSMSSINQLRSYSGTVNAFYRSGGVTYVKLRTRELIEKTGTYKSMPFVFDCP